MVMEWQLRKKMFSNIFGPIEENHENPKKLLKEIGVETDDDANVKFNDHKHLTQRKRMRP